MRADGIECCETEISLKRAGDTFQRGRLAHLAQQRQLLLLPVHFLVHGLQLVAVAALQVWPQRLAHAGEQAVFQCKRFALDQHVARHLEGFQPSSARRLLQIGKHQLA